MNIFSRSRNLRKPWKLAVKRPNYMKAVITSNATAIALFRIRASGLRLSQFSRTEPRQTASGQRVITAISEIADRPGPALDLQEGGKRGGAARPGGNPVAGPQNQGRSGTPAAHQRSPSVQPPQHPDA